MEEMEVTKGKAAEGQGFREESTFNSQGVRWCSGALASGLSFFTVLSLASLGIAVAS